jgi:hypothetical protein
LSPHILFLLVILVTGGPINLIFLVSTTFGAKGLIEWLFWNSFSNRLNAIPDFKNWKAVVNRSLLDHPNVGVALITILTDIATDVALVYFSLKTSLPMLWIFLSLLGCQALSSPIQGFLSDCFSQKKSLLFALIACLCAIGYATTFHWDGQPNDYSKQMLFVLCCKGLLGNVYVIARAAIAKVIKVETIKLNPKKQRQKTAKA